MAAYACGRLLFDLRQLCSDLNFKFSHRLILNNYGVLGYVKTDLHASRCLASLPVTYFISLSSSAKYKVIAYSGILSFHLTR